MKKSILIIVILVLTNFWALKISAQTTDYSRFRFAVNGGYGFRAINISEKILGNSMGSDHGIGNTFREKINLSGLQYDLGVAYFFTELFGIGLKYTGYQVSYLTFFQTGQHNNGWAVSPTLGSRTNTYWRHFIRPTLNFRVFNSTRNICFVGTFGVGYFSNVSDPSLEKISALAGSVSLGVDIFLVSSVALGFQISLLQSVPTSREIWKGGSLLSEKTNVSGIEFSVGLRF